VPENLTAALLALAYLAGTAGLGWLALAMDVHWKQLRGPQAAQTPARGRVLRALGLAGLAASLLLCLAADHTSIAVLVWIMTLAAAALSVALALSWRPALLAALVAWVRD
jgi:hypothetical protein